MAKISVRSRDVQKPEPEKKVQVRTRDVTKSEKSPGKAPISAAKPKSEPSPAPQNTVTKSDVVRLERLLSGIPKPDLSPIEARLRNQEGHIEEIRKAITEKNAAKDYTFDIIRGSDNKITKVLAREGIAKEKAVNPDWPEFMNTSVKN